MSEPQSKGPIKHRTRGPVELGLELVFAFFAITVTSWFMGFLIAVLGPMALWEQDSLAHTRALVMEDLGHIDAAPRSLLIDDTKGFSLMVISFVQKPYEALGILKWYQSAHAQQGQSTQQSVSDKGLNKQTFANASRVFNQVISSGLVLSMFVLQDTLLRESIAVFALPAFLLACLLGLVDGLIRRDLRRWGGGRESSFIYHHAKRYTVWALTGGFALYLTWPFGGFNPSLMILVFTALVALTLSTTVASFKKYV